MDTLDNRVRRVQTRRQALRRQRERRQYTLLLSLNLAVFGALFYVISRQTSPHQPLGGTSSAASSMLESSAGGYVLTAVLGFVFGVLLAVLCRRWAVKNREASTDESNGGKRDE